MIRDMKNEMRIVEFANWSDVELESNGFDRGISGTIDINGMEFLFNLYTEDGFTSIYIIKNDSEFNLEDEDEVEELGLTGFGDCEIYDFIINALDDDE